MKKTLAFAIAISLLGASPPSVQALEQTGAMLELTKQIQESTQEFREANIEFSRRHAALAQEYARQYEEYETSDDSAKKELRAAQITETAVLINKNQRWHLNQSFKLLRRLIPAMEKMRDMVPENSGQGFIQQRSWQEFQTRVLEPTFEHTARVVRDFNLDKDTQAKIANQLEIIENRFAALSRQGGGRTNVDKTIQSLYEHFSNLKAVEEQLEFQRAVYESMVIENILAVSIRYATQNFDSGVHESDLAKVATRDINERTMEVQRVNYGSRPAGDNGRSVSQSSMDSIDRYLNGDYKW